LVDPYSPPELSAQRHGGGARRRILGYAELRGEDARADLSANLVAPRPDVHRARRRRLELIDFLRTLQLHALVVRAPLRSREHPRAIALCTSLDGAGRRAQQRAAQEPGAADERVSGERQLCRRREDLHVRVALDKDSLRVAELGGDRLPACLGDVAGVAHDAERVAAGAGFVCEHAQHAH
jgi:hypothetical protein